MAKRRGKYAGIVDTLPAEPLIDPSRQDVVDVVKDQILAPPDTADLLTAAEPIDIDAGLKQVEHIINTINAQMIRDTRGRRWASEFARLYAKVRGVRTKLATLDSTLSVTQDAYTVLMVEQMENEGMSSIKLSDGQPVSTYPEPYAKVFDRDLFRHWCIEQGLMRQLMLPWQTTNMLLKKRLLAGEPEPPGVEARAITRVRLGAEP